MRESRPSTRLRGGGRRTTSHRGNGASPVLLRADERRRAGLRNADQTAHPAFFFDLACPFSYIAAESVERLLGDIEWVPAYSTEVHPDVDAARRQAAALARAARVPLVWPDGFPAPVPRAMRAAAYAAEVGAGARFALAASRLAFCGGFDLEKPSVLADVAAAAGVCATECVAAADEAWRDEDLRATAQTVRSLGAGRLPVLSAGERWFDGLHALSEAAAWLKRA